MSKEAMRTIEAALVLGKQHAEASCRNARFEGGRAEYRDDVEKIDAALSLLRAELEAGGEAVKHWCETCEGLGTIDETLGGESFSNPRATCPDCDGQGWWTPSRQEASPVAADTQGDAKENCNG